MNKLFTGNALRSIVYSAFPMTRSRINALCAITVSAVVLTAATAEPPPQTLDLGTLPIEVVDDVVIPIPQEIFASLDKLGKQNWGAQLVKKDVERNTSRSRTALLFGLVISDGFIAVQAKDKDSVSTIGRDVLVLAEAVGPSVKEAVAGHAQAIIDYAEANDWSAVRTELDRTRQTVIDTMEENRDRELSDLVSIGGWLGGTRALSGLVASNYSADGSELLNQPELLDQISDVYAKLSERVKRGDLFDKVAATLLNLRPLMRTNDEGLVPEQSVQEIASITTSLTEDVYAK